MFIENNDKATLATLNQLKQDGFRVVLDDFGTNYSSLGYLKRLAIDALKIDRTLIQNLTTDDNDLMLVASIIDLAHNFNLTAVAEGVENKSQELILIQHGCDFVQGYFYSHPLSLNNLLAQFNASRKIQP